MSKVIVIGYNTYSFPKENGEIIEGVKVSFLTQERAKGENKVGYLPLQTSLDITKTIDFKEVPGLYNANYDMVPGKGNKPTLALTNFEFIKGVDLNALFK